MKGLHFCKNLQKKIYTDLLFWNRTTGDRYGANMFATVDIRVLCLRFLDSPEQQHPPGIFCCITVARVISGILVSFQVSYQRPPRG